MFTFSAITIYYICIVSSCLHCCLKIANPCVPEIKTIQCMHTVERVSNTAIWVGHEPSHQPKASVFDDLKMRCNNLSPKSCILLLWRWTPWIQASLKVLGTAAARKVIKSLSVVPEGAVPVWYITSVDVTSVWVCSRKEKKLIKSL